MPGDRDQGASLLLIVAELLGLTDRSQSAKGGKTVSSNQCKEPLAG